jgi:hypothetical protein
VLDGAEEMVATFPFVIVPMGHHAEHFRVAIMQSIQGSQWHQYGNGQRQRNFEQCHCLLLY